MNNKLYSRIIAESDSVLGVVRSGKGKAKVVGYWHDPLYEDVYAMVKDVLPPSDSGIVFLDSLTNGGQKGAGAKVVNRAIEQVVNGMGYRLVIIPISERGEQQKLVDWYASLGTLTQIPNTDWFYA